MGWLVSCVPTRVTAVAPEAAAAYAPRIHDNSVSPANEEPLLRGDKLLGVNVLVEWKGSNHQGVVKYRAGNRLIAHFGSGSSTCSLMASETRHWAENAKKRAREETDKPGKDAKKQKLARFSNKISVV